MRHLGKVVAVRKRDGEDHLIVDVVVQKGHQFWDEKFSATIEIPSRFAAAYPVGRKVVLTLTPAV